MIKLTANYSNSNHNFVIQNISSKQEKNKYLPAICIIKNILQRGNPTLMSTFLQESVGSIQNTEEFNKAYPLIDTSAPKWSRIIRGDVEGNNFPAKRFFEELIPKYLPDYQYIQQLILPEVSINEITKVDVKEFREQQVDFYLPQAFLIIEIDGSQHDEKEDAHRDAHTSKYAIKTVRLKVSDLNQENDIFLKKINEIKDRIDRISSRQSQLKFTSPCFITLEDYALAAKSGVDINNPYYKSSAVIRFQLLILELLENGVLKLTDDWNFELIERDASDFAELAIKDLFVWFKHILQLHKIDFNEPKFFIKKRKSLDNFSNETTSIKIDFSLLKRYTDEFQEHEEVYFVRTDYLDVYMYFSPGKGNKLEFSSFEPYDYFCISSTKLVNYKLKFGKKDSDEKPLLFLLWNLFLQNNPELKFDKLAFREGQLPIISNALSRKDTLGLLPTGSGKSVCYQLASILQPAISFVVCPIKSLMYDQKADLDLSMFTRTNHITSDDKPWIKEKIQTEFGAGKYFFIYISPERFQTKKFRNYFITVNKDFNIAYAVIDEVHCLSEWGHDFRTSYLNLADTINKFCQNFTFIGLTATASVNVKDDIQIEFGIKEENVKTPLDYTREELEFVIINDNNDKKNMLFELIERQKNEIGALAVKGGDTKCGIIFTPAVGGPRGCFKLSQELSNKFNHDVRYFAGTIPNELKETAANDFNFDDYKRQVQDDFKQNKYSLLAATKAFGMGINKGNIYYTVHYGIPGSVEALYQEAGRAGREKTRFKDNPAKCFVLLTKSNQADTLKKLWNPSTPLSELRKLKVRGDINSQLYFFVTSNENITDEFNIVKEIYNLAKPGQKNFRLISADLKTTITKKIKDKQVKTKLEKPQVEKAIYRLKLLGIVSDWTIIKWDKMNSVFELDFLDFSESTIKNSVLSNIEKYDKDFSFDAIRSDEKYLLYRKIIDSTSSGITLVDKYIFLLLQWTYDNFAYNRRQQLKNIYEYTCAFADGELTHKEFKTRLENYFKISQTSDSFQNIVKDKEKNVKEWFNVFYQIKQKKQTTDFITLEEQKEKRDNLSRFLESSQQDTGLDMISGLIRLLLDDYDNADGRDRLESSLNAVKDYSDSKQDFIINEIIKIGMHCDEKNKSLLSESLHNIVNDSKEFLFKLSLELEDSFSICKLLTDINKKLTTINEENYGRLEKIG
jgi:ATP-dependent DNA helicase RecQ